MDDQARLSALISDIYDAALDPARWHAVLAVIADFIGGQSAALGSIDVVNKSIDAPHTFGCDPHYLRLHIGEYAKIDPTAALLLVSAGQVISTADIMPYDDYVCTRFYQEWARPQGWVDSANVVLNKTPSGFAIMSVYRDRATGLVDDDTRSRMRLIGPHVQRAVSIGQAIDVKTADHAALADALDGIAAGIFLVDAAARIVHANDAGRTLLADSAMLRTAGGRLVAADPVVRQALHDALSAAAIRPAGAAVALPLTARQIAHVVPLTAGARHRAGAGYDAVAAVFVHTAEPNLPAAAESLGRHYRLTPMELRVLLAIVEIGGVPAVADSLGIADTTAKTHLGRVYAKTGTRRQVDLVKLVAGFRSPLLR